MGRRSDPWMITIASVSDDLGKREIPLAQERINFAATDAPGQKVSIPLPEKYRTRYFLG